MVEENTRGRKVIVKDDQDAAEINLDSPEIKGVLLRVLIGPDDGSNNMVMRYFTVLPEGHTPFHSHAFEHVIRIVKGKGIVQDEEGKEIMLEEGQSFFVSEGEKHQFINPFQQPFGFLCIILSQ